MQQLRGRVVIVTGATAGIGRCLARLLAAHGARLAVCGRSEERLESLHGECTGDHPPLLRSFCVSSEQAIVGFVDEVEAVMGPVDVLINCAGSNTARSNVADLKMTDLDWVLAVNLRAPTIFMREVFQRMRLRKTGHIVNIISTAARFSNEGIAAYSAAKAGLDALTRVFRKEARASGIAVTAVFPGGVNTQFRAKPNPDYMSAETVAETIVNVLTVNADAAVHELILRPMVETNFA